MTLTAGVRLGPYEILALLGAGGMGEVYKAKDTRLNRIVALKVLPRHLRDNPELKERFEREAQAVAALNHAHICILHDIGHDSGTDFLVMEYLEGQTLAERLEKGALPLDHALQYAIQIADALDRAHRNGIVHRDLKPGNVMLTKNGVKLLDFGLAKLQPTGAVAGMSVAATMTSPLTAQGTILGTLQYMAPEQLEGHEADARADLFALGAVIYEMATGRKAFIGSSPASVMAAILSSEPPSMCTIQRLTPPLLDRVVKTCLAKDADQRWQTAHDLLLQLKWIAEGGATTEFVPVVSRPKTRERAIWAFAAFVLGAFAAAVGLRVTAGPSVSPPSTPQPAKRVTIKLADTEPLALAKFGPLGIGRTAVALSPDGSLLAYAAERNNTSQLYVRAFDQFHAKPIPGTEHAYNPFFSPDGRWLGFFADNKLKKVSLQGGQPVTLCEARIPHGANWGPDDTIVFADSEGVNLSRVSAAGGRPEVLPKSEEISRVFYPEFLPDGKTVVSSSAGGGSSPDSYDIVALSLETGEWRVLLKGGTNPRYVATGHLVFARAGTILAAPFDVSRLEVTGPAVTLVEGVRIEEWGAAQFAVSPEGTLVYLTGAPAWIGKLTWVDQHGISKPLAAPAQAYGSLRLSPDGQRLAATVFGVPDDVWVYEFARQNFTRLTTEGVSRTPRWTPDGKRIVHTRRLDPNQYQLVWKFVDGSGPEEVLATSKYTLGPESFSPDGTLLAFYEWRGDTGGDLWTLPLQGDRKASPWLVTKFNEWGPAFSPDGRWIAYTSDESGEFEIYVQPYPGPGRKSQISAGGGEEVVWSRDGRKLFYRNRLQWMSAAVETQPEFRAEPPKVMFEGPYLNVPGVSYDVAADGQRLIMIEENQPQARSTELNIVLHWTAELKRAVPTK
jgi:serine/threonine-protein kinase